MSKDMPEVDIVQITSHGLILEGRNLTEEWLWELIDNSVPLSELEGLIKNYELVSASLIGDDEIVENLRSAYTAIILQLQSLIDKHKGKTNE